MNKITEAVQARAAQAAAVVAGAAIAEHLPAPYFTYDFECVGPVESLRARYVELRDRIQAGLATAEEAREFAAIPLERKWADTFRNTVTDAGANDLLDKYFAGSTYTAAWYVGLISSTSYTAISASDTMASHAGWTEASTNQPTYSQANRPALAFSSASSRSKATSSASAFSITGTGTAKGAFITTNNTKGGSTGILYSAGLFSGGDRAVINGDTINVSATLSA